MQGRNRSVGLPPLAGNAISQVAYKLVELWLWSIWFVQNGRVNGKPPDEPFVLVANHSSYLDWMLLHVLVRKHFRRNVCFLAKKKVVQNRWLRVPIKAAAPVVVEPQHAERCLTIAAHGWETNTPKAQMAFGIFPEGRRSRTGKQLANAPGAAWLARKCQVPIVPVALCRFWEVWPPHKSLPSFKRFGLVVNFLPPINPSDFVDDQAAVDCAMKRVYEVVRHERVERLKTNGD